MAEQQQELELDDEFEEFAVDGRPKHTDLCTHRSTESHPPPRTQPPPTHPTTDWTAKKPNPADPSLWVLDWDTDEAQQDDFGKQLAEELARTKAAKQQ